MMRSSFSSSLKPAFSRFTLLLSLFYLLPLAVSALDLPAGLTDLLGLQQSGKNFSVQRPEMLKAFGFANINEGDAVQILPGKDGNHRVRVLGTGEERPISLGSSPATGQTRIQTGNGTVLTNGQKTLIKQGNSTVRTTSDGSVIQTGNTSVRTSSKNGNARIQSGGTVVETSEDRTHIQSGDTEIRTGPEGVNIRAGDTMIKTGPGGISIKAPGVNINTGGGLNLNMSELIPDMNVGDDDDDDDYE